MLLTSIQVDRLLALIATTQNDQITCDDCLLQIAEFGEQTLRNQPLDQAQELVQIHLESCPCCADEFQLLLAALEALQGPAAAD